MSFYRLDRFARFGFQTMVAPAPTSAPAPAPTATLSLMVPPPSVAAPVTTLQAASFPSVVTLASQRVTSSKVQPEPTATAPMPKSEQQVANEQLAQLEAQAHAADVDAAMQAAEDPGAPKSTSPLLYVALGIGGLVLVGGAYFLAKPKSKKLSGYRRRRKSRRRRR